LIEEQAEEIKGPAVTSKKWKLRRMFFDLTPSKMQMPLENKALSS
jgi:hypothetical protein